MGPTFKMSLLVLVAAGLILSLGQLALHRSEQTLMQSIEEGAGARASDLMGEIDRSVDLRIGQWQAYAESDLVRQTLERSNRQLAAISRREATLTERERTWRAAFNAGGSELSREISSNRLARDLARQLVALNAQAGEEIFGEVLITNRHGVAIAETRLSPDYRHDDEDWWQMAAQEGVTIDSLEVDREGELATSICLRIEGEDGGLAGVLKTVIHLAPLLRVIDGAASTEALAGKPNVVLLDADYRIVHQSGGREAPLSDGLHFVEGAVLDPEAKTVSLRRLDPRSGSSRLSAYARSQGHLGEEEHGWILLLEYDADAILAATSGLREGILHSALLAAIGLILFSVPISISFSRDNLKRRNLEQALRNASQARSDFVVTASRELRAPMTVMKKAIRDLEDSPLDESQSRSLEVLHANSRAMGVLLEDALNLSRFEDDRSPVVIEPFDIRACFEEVHPVGRAAAHAKGLTIRLDLPSHLPEQLRGDAALIRQIYLQLVGNAIRFTEEGQIDVRLRLDLSQTAEPWMDLWVSDTGVGIARSEFESIFETEDRAGSLVSRHHGGVGDGLAVTRRWVEMLDGRIEVNSERGAGSTFHVRIPVDHMDAEPEFHEDGPAQISERIGSVEGVRVLLVEDHAAVRRATLRVLDKLGCETEFCVNGADAVERVRAEEFDAVLMDCSMPVLDGFEASRQIRDLSLEYYLPIIAVTANPSDNDRRRCLAAGMDEILSKPVGLVQLCEMLAHWSAKNRKTPRASDHRPHGVPDAEAPADQDTREDEAL